MHRDSAKKAGVEAHLLQRRRRLKGSAGAPCARRQGGGRVDTVNVNVQNQASATAR